MPTYRAAMISPPDRMKQHLAQAIRENPMEGPYYVAAARVELQSRSPDKAAVRRSFETALGLDPNNVPLRLEYANVLADFGDSAAARAQYEEALRYNGLLNADEKKRLKAQEVEEIRKKVRGL